MITDTSFCIFLSFLDETTLVFTLYYHLHLLHLKGCFGCDRILIGVSRKADSGVAVKVEDKYAINIALIMIQLDRRNSDHEARPEKNPRFRESGDSDEKYDDNQKQSH
nr:nuclear cap-binding protein subunit 2 [Ipomoea batatas]GMD57320.1 nuclear cap-binding protein subunit 2 [Ipomoea batatas]